MGACRFLHWSPPDVLRPPIKNQNMPTGKYSLTKKALRTAHIKCAYDRVQLFYTIQHRAVLMISLLSSRQSPQIRWSWPWSALELYIRIKHGTTFTYTCTHDTPLNYTGHSQPLHILQDSQRSAIKLEQLLHVNYVGKKPIHSGKSPTHSRHFAKVG